MSEQGGVKLTLAHRPKDHEPVNGLSALFERLVDSDDGQYVLLRVAPVETTKRRHDGARVVTVEIRAIEPLVDDNDRRAAQSLMEAATRLRLDRDRRTPDTPEDLLADLDAQAREQSDGWRDETTGLISGGLVTDEDVRRARAMREDPPMAGRDFDADGQPWDDEGAERMRQAAPAGAFDDI
jgi:hypothetical protein